MTEHPDAGTGAPDAPDLSATLPSRVPFTPAVALAAVAARAARTGAPPPTALPEDGVDEDRRPDDARTDLPERTRAEEGQARFAQTRVPAFPDHAAARRRAERLVDALVEPGSIRAVFQPMVRLADGAVVAYEALARTRVVAGRPDQWLDAAGMVGRRVEVELACLRAVAEAGPPRDGALVSVNISPAALLDPRLPEALADLPRHALEITEHDAVQDYDALSAVLARLRTSGSLVAVDDVGAGYASMAHVLALAPSFVKIDRSLVDGMHRDPGRRALVQALQAFTSAIGGLTVAEGVEHVGDLDELRAVGVDLVQGYVVARPGPPWPELTPTALRMLRPEAPDPRQMDAADPAALEDALAAAATQGEACEAVATHLAAFGGLLPSVYLERGGVLRCQSRQGQWLVLDGLLPGAGLTGTAFAEEREVLVEDVSTDARYRLAVPGVRAELAVPVRVDGRVVGVCNVDSVVPISTAAAVLVRRCAAQLGARLSTLPEGREAGGALHELTRFTPAVVTATGPEAVAAGVLGAVADLVGFESGCVWRLSDSGVQAAVGPQARSLAVLPPFRVQELAALVAGTSSCCTGGTGLGPTSLATDALSDLGARGVLLVPVRDGRRVTDLLVVVSSTRTTIPADLVVAAEHLCLLSGGRLAAQREGLGASLLRRVGKRRPAAPGPAPAEPAAPAPGPATAAQPPAEGTAGRTPFETLARRPVESARPPAARAPSVGPGSRPVATWIREAGAGPSADALPALLSALTASSTAIAEPTRTGPLGVVSELVYRDVLAGLADRAAEAAHRLRPVVEALGDSVTARNLRYLEALALLELAQFAEALVVAEQLLVEAGRVGPAWRCTALAVVAEAHTGLGSAPASIAALAEADWLLRGMRAGTAAHVRASMVVARALRAARLYERAEAVLRGLDPVAMPASELAGGRDRGVLELLVAREHAALQAEWAAMLRLVGRDAEAAARASLVISTSLRVQRRALAMDEPAVLARGRAAEAFGWILLGEVGLAEALARIAAVEDLQGRCLGREVLHLTLGEAAMLAGRHEEAAELLGAALETASAAGREVWSTLTRALLAELELRSTDPATAALRWKEVALASLGMVWAERGSRFTALHGQDSIRALEARVERHGRASEEDPLTGLGNRRLLQRVGEGVRPESVIFVDVDDFKTINDRFSHAVGDRALEVVAQILRATARSGDLLVRYGGDEFVVVPHGPADVARALAHRIRAAVEEFDWAGLAPGMSLTVSVGLGRSGHRLDGVLSADQAMLEAKRAGRNQVVEAEASASQDDS